MMKNSKHWYLRKTWHNFPIFVQIFMWKGWMILSKMGDMCKICEKDGELFATHFFTDSKVKGFENWEQKSNF